MVWREGDRTFSSVLDLWLVSYMLPFAHSASHMRSYSLPLDIPDYSTFALFLISWTSFFS